MTTKAKCRWRSHKTKYLGNILGGSEKEVKED